MNQSAQPRIVGTGHVGKAAALFLAREGIPTQIIDRAGQPVRIFQSMAGIPRTPEIMESTGRYCFGLKKSMIPERVLFPFIGLDHPLEIYVAILKKLKKGVMAMSTTECG